MNSTFYEFINIESNIRNCMDGLPAEVNSYDFKKSKFLIYVQVPPIRNQSIKPQKCRSSGYLKI